MSDLYHLPGAERERPKYGTIPTLAGDVVAWGGRARFPFRSWASAAGFQYPPTACGFLCRTESAAEAYFARGFVDRAGVRYVDGAALAGDGTTLRPQVCHGLIRLDFVVARGSCRFAVEIDGYTYHRRREQVEADTLRARRVVALGYVVVRFTAHEVFADTSECWRQLEAILAAHAKAL